MLVHPIMQKKLTLCFTLLLLVLAIAMSGCTSQKTVPAAPTATPTLVPTAIPATSLTTLPTTEKTSTDVSNSNTVIVNSGGMISPTEFRTFPFSIKGDDFSPVGTNYTITITADKPVIGYAVTSDMAGQLQSSEMVPHYVASSDFIQWGLITPYMSMGRVTSSTKTFTVTTLHSYVYVIDARWMQSSNDYKATQPFSYKLVITRTFTPSPTLTILNS